MVLAEDAAAEDAEDAAATDKFRASASSTNTVSAVESTDGAMELQILAKMGAHAYAREPEPVGPIMIPRQRTRIRRMETEPAIGYG